MFWRRHRGCYRRKKEKKIRGSKIALRLVGPAFNEALDAQIR